MRNIQSFDPSSAANGQIVTQAVNPCSVMVLFNHSLYGLILTFPDGSTGRLPPWYYRYYYLEMPGNVNWAQEFSLASSGAPISLITGEMYEPSEAAGRSFSEGPLPLQFNLGNTVQTNVSATDIVNEGNPAGTNVLRAKQSGSTGNNASILNDGNFVFGQWVSSVFTELLKLVPGATPNLILGKGLIVQGTDSAGLINNIFGVDGAKNTFIQNHGGHDQTVIYDKNGNAICKFDGPSRGLDIPTTQASVVGTTAGTATLYQFLVGTIKACILFQNGYRNASGTEQRLALPVPFTTRANYLNGNASVNIWKSGSIITNGIAAITTLASGGGTATTVSTIPSLSIGEIAPGAGWDEFGMGTLEGANRTGMLFAIGI